MDEEFNANLTNLTSEINKITQEDEKYQNILNEAGKEVEMKNKELGINEINIKRNQLQNDFDELLNKTKQLNDEVQLNQRKFRLIKTDCVLDYVDEVNCTMRLNEVQEKIKNSSQELTTAIQILSQKQQEISEHEETSNIALNEILKVLKEFAENEKLNIIAMKTLEGEFIQKSYERESLIFNYETRKDELKKTAKNEIKKLQEEN